VLATTIDPDGRRVILREERWRHIKDDHADLARHLRDIMAAVREPDLRMPGRVTGEEWYLVEGIGPARWLHVAVHYERDEGWIVTAFPRRSRPR
jgi:hypothetical protein